MKRNQVKNYELFNAEYWYCKEYDRRKKIFRGWTKEQFNEMSAKALLRLRNKCLMVDGILQTIDGLHAYRAGVIKALKNVPFGRENYTGDGFDDYNGYLEFDKYGCSYICPGERGNNFFTNDPILIKLLKHRYEKCKKNTAMKVLKDNRGDLFIVSTDKIERIYLHDAYDEFGQQFGYDNAGDYSICNSQSAAQNDMREAGAAIFGENFKSLEFEADCNDGNFEITFDNLDDVELSDRLDEIVEFMKNWEKENAIYVECECINYFDGNNWQSKIINAVEFGAELFNVDEDLENEILDAYENADDWQDFGTGSRSESCGYVFETTSCPSFYSAKITM